MHQAQPLSKSSAELFVAREQDSAQARRDEGSKSAGLLEFKEGLQLREVMMWPHPLSRQRWGPTAEPLQPGSFLNQQHSLFQT